MVSYAPAVPYIPRSQEPLRTMQVRAGYFREIPPLVWDQPGYCADQGEWRENPARIQ
ncbi:hypothetical protein ASZ90_016612 [hydrocarbon metagenome]|uniref:Uncharacterized protein n=1 Tax=hydrocarbon metagenome TaxID=938273 RepID=A0A0W8EMC8_9ZZZZ